MPDLRRQFEYDGWANREALASLRAAGAPPAPAAQVMAHIIAAEVLWHARLNHASAPLAVWPDLSLPQCEAWLDNLARVWPKYLDAVVPSRLAERVGYTNTKGETFSSTVDDILMHVVIHSAYHRGQIAAALRTAGHQPALTDFVHATRTGRIA